MNKVWDGYVMSVYLSITSSLSPDAFDALSFPPSSFDRFNFAGSRPPDNALPLPPSSTVAAACSSGEPEFHVSFGVIATYSCSLVVYKSNTYSSLISNILYSRL